MRGSTHALRSVSLDVPEGRVTGLLGPSGSGKTTLMRAIVGVQTVRGGTVEVLGLPAGSSELRPRVGYMTQAPSVYGDLSARENLAYFARVLGVSSERVQETLELIVASDEIIPSPPYRKDVSFNRGTHVIHCGGACDSHLLVPVISPA